MKITVYTILPSLSILAIVLVFFMGCVKEVDQFVPFEQLSTDIDLRVFGSSDDTLEFEIAGSTISSLWTKGGSYLLFEPEIFQYTDGTPCPCETIQVKIIELSRKSDLVIYGSPTFYSNQLLANLKTFNVTATAEGRQLHLRTSKYFSLFTPSKDPDTQMQLFFQDPNEQPISWIKAESISGSSPIEIGEWKPDKESLIGYKSEVQRLGWISISKFNAEPSNNQVHIKLDSSHDQNNTVIYAIARESQSVLQFDQVQPNYFRSLIPVDMEVILLGIARNGTDSYSVALENVHIQSNQELSISFQPQSVAEIRSILESL